MSTNVPRALETRLDLNGNTVIDPVWDDDELTNPTRNWGNNRQAATLAHRTTWRTYKYFLDRFGINGADGQGTIARIVIAPSYQRGAT